MIKCLCSKTTLQPVFPPCAALELMGSAGYTNFIFPPSKKSQFFNGTSHKNKLEMFPWHKPVWFTGAATWETAGAHPTHHQSRVSRCSSLGKPGQPAQEPVSPGDEAQAASQIVLTGVHLLHQAGLPVWDAAPPPAVIQIVQARTTFHRRSPSVTGSLYVCVGIGGYQTATIRRRCSMSCTKQTAFSY